MATSPVASRCGRLIALRSHAVVTPKTIDAFDRYSVIRNFFRQQHTWATPASAQSSMAQSWQGRAAFLAKWTLEKRPLSPLTEFGSSRSFVCSCGAKAPNEPKHQHHESQSNPVKESTTSSTPQTPDPGGSNTPPPPPPQNLDNYSEYFRRLALSLPHVHRPTRDDFLNVSTGFWERLSIRFKWFTIKSFRKFNADDISAFITWFLMSQTLWIFVGT